MSSKLFSCSINGLDCNLVEVEADVIRGVSSFDVVGLTDTAIQEARHRVFPAIKNSGFEFPRRKKIVNLAPADLRKQGPHFDLAIALGLLEASDQIELTKYRDSIFVGELALDGDLRPINGSLIIANFAKEIGFKKLFLPDSNAKEASLINGIEIYPIKNLKQLADEIMDIEKIKIFENSQVNKYSEENDDMHFFDMADIHGQMQAKRGLEIAAAGSHNILFSGPPGSGKTLLAKTLPSILPALNMEESLEVTKIYSIAGLLPKDKPLKTIRPFRTVHHTASGVSIIGGGRIPKPGEISLSHRGVLFFDELPEFPQKVLELLRQPLEDRKITIGRVQSTLSFPAHFIFIAAMNPCPCGFLTDSSKQCKCSDNQIKNYQKKISGPLLDRIDLIIEVPRLDFKSLSSNTKNRSSKEILEKIKSAKTIQLNRFKDYKIFSNSEMESSLVKKFCTVDEKTQNLLKSAVERLNLSGRSYFRILKVARTIADLDMSDNIELKHLSEALQYRDKISIS